MRTTMKSGAPQATNSKTVNGSGVRSMGGACVEICTREWGYGAIQCGGRIRSCPILSRGH